MIASHSPRSICRPTRSRASTPWSYLRVTLSMWMKDTRAPFLVSPEGRRRLHGQRPPQRQVDGDQTDGDRRAEHGRDDARARLDGGAEQTRADQPGEPRPDDQPRHGPQDPQEPHLAQEHPEDLAVTGADRPRQSDLRLA